MHLFFGYINQYWRQN